MKRLLLLAVVIPTFPALAQSNGAIPSAAEDALARDLRNLQSSIEAAQNSTSSPLSSKAEIAGIASVDVTKSQAFVKAGASKAAGTITTLPEGGRYRVVDKVGDWYAVELKQPAGRFKTGWINAADVTPLTLTSGKDIQLGGSSPQTEATVYDVIVQKASEMKEKYRNNPYFSVTGFTVNIGLPPSVSMNFAFKK